MRSVLINHSSSWGVLWQFREELSDVIVGSFISVIPSVPFLIGSFESGNDDE